MAPSYSYQIRFEVDGEDYSRTVPISHVLRRGEADRLLFHIAAEKSSIHEFDLTLRYNETEKVRSGPVRLELFLSRLDAYYVEQEARFNIQGSRPSRGLASLVKPLLEFVL